MGEAGIGAAQFRRKPWGVRGESFDVQFVDDGFAPWHMRVGWFSHMLVDVAVVNGHGNRHVSQKSTVLIGPNGEPATLPFLISHS